MIPSLSPLKFYTVHLMPGVKTDEESLRFVREGFCWLAFLFTLLWALYHRLWFLAGLIVTVNVALVYGVNWFELNPEALSILQLGFQLWLGFHANDFLREGLKQRGFITAAIVSGENQGMAQRRFFDQHTHLITA